MKTLFEQVYSKYSATNALTAVLPRLYSTKGSQAASLPYAVFMLVSNAPRFTFSGIFDNALVQFNIYDDIASGDATIHSIHTQLIAAFDWYTPTDGDDQEYVFVRELEMLMEVEDVYQYVIEYRVRRKPA